MRNMLKPTSESDPNRLARLREDLHDWGIDGDYEAFDAWVEYQQRNILPFAGGWLEQPRWIRKAFHTLNRVYTMEYDQKDLPVMDAISDAPKNLFNFSIKAKDTDG